MKGKTDLTLDLPLPVQGATKVQSAYNTLRLAIVERRLPPETRLPSSRMLSQRWQVSRSTIEAAYDQLRSEGYIVSRRGSGTRVAHIVPDGLSSGQSGFVAADGSPADHVHLLSSDRAMRFYAVQPGVAFTARMPDPAIFPWTLWRKCLNQAVGSGDARLHSFTDPRGYQPLRQQIAQYLAISRGVDCCAEDVLVTTGIRHALDVCARALLTSGAKACIEEPGYPGSTEIFSLTTQNIAHVPVTRAGIDVATLAESHGDAALVYVTPAHQAPSGVAMSLAVRRDLIAWSEQSSAWIVEDDYDSEFNYLEAPLPALRSMSRDKVIFCGSFNKTLFAGLRIGYIVAPAAIRERLENIRRISGGANSILEQRALAIFMEEGYFAKHLRVARLEYQRRRDAILDVLINQLEGDYEITGEKCGLHMVLWHASFGDTEFVKYLSDVGLKIQVFREFCRDSNHEPAALLGYAALPLSACRASAMHLARELNQHRKAHPETK